MQVSLIKMLWPQAYGVGAFRAVISWGGVGVYTPKEQQKKGAQLAEKRPWNAEIAECFKY